MSSNEILLGCTRSELRARQKTLERERATPRQLRNKVYRERRLTLNGTYHDTRGSTAVLRAMWLGQTVLFTAYDRAWRMTGLHYQLRPKRYRAWTTADGVCIERIK